MGVKATFYLDEKIIERGRKLVGAKRFKSMNAFVEKAMRDELDILEKEEIKRALCEASRDPLFLADIKEIEKDFAHTDFEKVKK
jgi:Arc/MetJ-type ribon-helix-helix transcriptional regulator